MEICKCSGARTNASTDHSLAPIGNGRGFRLSSQRFSCTLAPDESLRSELTQARRIVVTHRRPDQTEGRRLYEATLAALIPIWEEHQSRRWDRTWYVGEETPLALMALALARVVSRRANRGKHFTSERMLAVRTRNYLSSASHSLKRASSILAVELARHQSPCVSVHSNLGDNSSWFVFAHADNLASWLARLCALPEEGPHITLFVERTKTEYRRLLADQNYRVRAGGSERLAA